MLEPRERRDDRAGDVVARRRAVGGRASPASASAPQVFELPFGRATIDPWPHIRAATAPARAHIGLTVLYPAPRPARRATCRSGGCSTTTRPSGAGSTSRSTSPGGPIDLVGVHLTSRLPYGPPIQLRRLAAQLPPPQPTGVVAGDCNFWGPGVVTFLPGWRRAVRGRTWPAQHAAQPDRPRAAARRPDARPARRRRRGAARRRLRPPPGARHPRSAVERRA